MKKTLFAYAIASLLSTAAFADKDCVKHLDEYSQGNVLLSLESCSLQDRDMMAVASYLAAHPGIFYLNLDDNNIGPAGIKALAKITSLTHISLDNNHIGPEGAAILANHKNLMGLTAVNNYLGTDGALALAQSKSLAWINVAGNEIDEEGIVALTRMSTLTGLGVAQNRLGENGVAAILNNPKLVSLDVSYTDMRSDALYKFVSTHPTLYLLGMSGLHLGDDAVAKILNSMPTPTDYSLVELYVADNDLSGYGLENVSRLVKTWLIRLDVSHNYIGDSGTMFFNQIADHGIMYLNLAENRISNAGAITLANASQYIQDLDIRYNRLSAEGIEALSNSKSIEYAKTTYDMFAPQPAKAKTKRTMTAAIKAYCATALTKACKQMKIQ